MAQLKKMMIQGIRSFSPDDGHGQVIEFFSPMTLIVGQNGSGKTTIIESLKYAITGVYPPNTKNGAFINDPKLSLGSEVKASVKLELLDKKSDKVVVSRKLKGTTKGKAGNVSMTSVEQTVYHLQTQRDGTIKRLDMSSKCGDIQEIINRIIGVSEPILNNVIFCHQEDSCWPLDEASKVKTKFDAIFNTTMYIKALKLFQDREKAMLADIKMAHESFKYSNEDLKEARKKAAKLEEHKIRLGSINDKIAEHEKEMEEITKKIRGLDSLRQNYVEKQNRVAKKEGEIGGLEQMIREFRGKIKEPFKGDMTSLQSKIDEFDFAFRQQSEALKTTKREKGDNDIKRGRLAEKHQEFVVSQGIFENNKRANDGRVEEMGKIMENLGRYIRNLKDSSQGESFSVSLDSVLMSLELDADSVEPNTAIKALDSAIASKLHEHKKLKTKIDSEEQKLQQEKLDFSNAERDIVTEVGMKQKSEAAKKEKADALRQSLNELEKSNDRLAEFDEKEQQIRETIERLEKSELTKNFETDIASLQGVINNLEEQKAVLQEQSSLLAADTNAVARMKSAQEQLAKKEKECSGILNRIEPELRNLLTGDEVLPKENLNSFLRGKLEKLKTEEKAKTDEINKMRTENTKVETNKKQVLRELEKKQKEISQIKHKSESVLRGASFVEEYANIFSQTEEAQSELSQNEAASFLYKQYVQKLAKKPCCPLCKRDFAKEAENKKLMDDLNKMMKKMELSKPEQETRLAELKTKQEQLVKLKPNWDIKERLEKVELPDLTQKKQEYETQMRTFEDTLGDLTETLSVLSMEKNSAESLLQDTTLYDKSYADRIIHDAEVRKWDSSRDPKAKELTMSSSDVQTEIQSIEGTITARRLEKDRKEKLRNETVTKLVKAKEERNRVVEQKLKITADLQNQDSMQQQKKELEAECIALRTSVQELNKKLPGIRAEFNRTEREITDLKKKGDGQLSALMKEKMDLETQKGRVTQLHKEIESFRSEVTEFEAQSKQRKECVDALAKCDKRIKELSDEIEILAHEVNNQEKKKAELENNKILKEKETKRDELKAEIESDKQAIEAAKLHGVNAQLEQECYKKDKIKTKRDVAAGSVRAERDTIQDLETELRDPKYANAEAKHRTRMIRKMVLERAQKDIRLYRIALDSAVMTFHRKKMELINKYMKFYWKKIYKGNDIDCIEIKTDNDEGATEKTVKVDMSKIQRKSYNYRVVATRRGIELDMRGRCSAGQKVLASIIIRLSLAQTFTDYCGIITLDEPTTNLDKENIASLAETLCDLANSMKSFKTFQLVVITHDQDFIDTLLRIDPIESYYRVKRDVQGSSIIERIIKR